MNDFREGQTIYVDAQNGETVFTTEIPEDGDGSLAKETDVEAEAPVPSPDVEEQDVPDEERDRLSKMMEE